MQRNTKQQLRKSLIDWGLFFGGIVVGVALMWWFLSNNVDFTLAQELLPTQIVETQRTPTPRPTGTADDPLVAEELETAEIAWSFQLPGEDTDYGSTFVSEDGTVVVTNTDDVVYTLSPDGDLIAEFTLDPPPYRVSTQGLFPQQASIPPTLTQDGTLIVVSDGLFYAVNMTGDLLWEVSIDSIPDGLPSVYGDTIYLLSKQGTLYRVDTQEGLQWTYETGLRGIGNVVIGPDGTLYMTISNLTSGTMLAVSPEGEPLWQSLADTNHFRASPIVDPNGNYVFLDDNIFDALTGERLDLEFPEGLVINRFFGGGDGNLYLLTGHTIMQWEVVGSSLSIIRTIAFDYTALNIPFQNTNLPFVIITSDQLVWLFYGFQTGQVIVWLNLEGEILNVFDTRYFSVNQYPDYEWGVIGVDMGNSIVYLCGSEDASDRIECLGYTLGESEPVWTQSIEGISGVNGSFMVNGRLYFITQENELFVVEMESP